MTLALVLAARVLLRLIVRSGQAASVMSVQECTLRRCCELCGPRCKRHHSRRRVNRLGGVHVILYSAGLRRDGLEYWIDAITRVSSREPLVLWNDALVCRCIEVMSGHKVGPTMLPAAASSSAQRQLSCCSSTLAILLLARVVLLLVGNQRLIVLWQSLKSSLNG